MANGVANKGGLAGGGGLPAGTSATRDSGFALRSTVITPSATGRCRGKLILV